MAGISNYLEEQWLNTLTGKNCTITNIYCALMTTASTDTTGGLEPTDIDYKRQKVTFDTAIQDEGQTTIKNNMELLFAAAITDWGTLTHFALFDAETNGNLLYHGALTAPKTVEEDEQIRIKTGEIKLRLD